MKIKPKGGKREGSGRKPGPNQTSRAYKIDNDLLMWINANIQNKNQYINQLIRADIQKKEPHQ